ncbi:MAG: cupin domain-containing protein [Haloplanus sp.]
MTTDQSTPTELTSLDELDAAPHATVFDGGDPEVVKLALARDERVPSHRHPDRTVVLYLVSGALALDLDDETYALDAGEAVRFDGARAVSPRALEPSVALVVLSPTAE